MTSPEPCPQPDLKGELWQIVSSIPAGEVSSYGRIAEALGDAKAARWVASELLRHPPQSDPCPCFRVVRQGGFIGSFAHGSSSDKAKLIATEGAEICEPEICEPGTPNAHIVKPVWASLPRLRRPPFAVMRDWQTNVAEKRLPQLDRLPCQIAGLDVSYLSDGRAAAACVVLDIKPEKRRPAQVVWSTTAVVEAIVPYVTGYLAFRELPALLAVYEQAVSDGKWPGLAMIDGSGRLHPRNAGLASCFSIATGQPSIGVTKTRLMGHYEKELLTSKSPQRIIHGDEHVGTAHQSPTGGKPVFVSPGCGIRQSDIDDIVAASTTIHRVPEPIYWADRLSRQHARTRDLVEE